MIGPRVEGEVGGSEENALDQWEQPHALRSRGARIVIRRGRGNLWAVGSRKIGREQVCRSEGLERRGMGGI